MLRDAPQYVRSLVDRFGAQEVWNAGIAILGFPPSWELSLDDSLQISRRMVAEIDSIPY